VIAPVRDEPGDAFCLDGKRLVSYGYPNVYRAFPDTFQRIIADYAAQDGWDGTKGPRSFQVFTKSGLILEYGGAESGRVLARGDVVRSWLITRISDRYGNTIDHEYINDKHPDGGYTVEHAPLRIEYTGHPLKAATRAVEFEYGPLEKASARILYARGWR
jgi:hypothetical protein